MQTLIVINVRHVLKQNIAEINPSPPQVSTRTRTIRGHRHPVND